MEFSLCIHVVNQLLKFVSPNGIKQSKILQKVSFFIHRPPQITTHDFFVILFVKQPKDGILCAHYPRSPSLRIDERQLSEALPFVQHNHLIEQLTIIFFLNSRRLILNRLELQQKLPKHLWQGKYLSFSIVLFVYEPSHFVFVQM